MPPAQPMKISPSSSESRFNKIRPLKSLGSSFSAPVRPVSSSTVKMHSIGPCCTVGSAMTARAAATPMPSSAPNVVPLAWSQSPLMTASIGSFSKSWTLSLFFSHTMSVCACKMIVLRSSNPGVAGAFMMTLPQGSTIYSTLCSLAQFSRYSTILPSFFEGRGTAKMPWNSFHTHSGVRFKTHSFISFYFLYLFIILKVL